MRWHEWALAIGAVALIYELLSGGRNREGLERDAAADTGSRSRPAPPPGRKPGDGNAGTEGADPGGAGADAGAPQGGGAKAVADEASRLIDRQDYSGCLSLLEAQPRKILAGTCAVEDALLYMLGLIRLLHKPDREFAAEILPHEPRMLKLVESVIRARSLDVRMNRSLGKYRSLVDYVSRVRLGHGSMLDDTGFFPWLDSSYPHVSRFLHADGAQIKKTSSLVHTLSIHFRSRDDPLSRECMGAVDGLCRQVMEICADRACDYAKKAAASWDSAAMEMAVLVAIDKCFGIGRIDPEIPGSERLADMSFVHGGVERYVEVYSHAGHDMAGTSIKEDIDPEEEWGWRFTKPQIASLREARAPAVYVMNLDDSQAQHGETRSPEFREAAARLMPPDSDIVVILHGEVEAASLRGGRMAGKSDMAARLEAAMRDAMPENSQGARP